MDIQRGMQIVVREDLKVGEFTEVKTAFGVHRIQWTKRMQEEIAGKTLGVKYVWYQDGTIRTYDGWRLNIHMIDMVKTELLNKPANEDGE